jgi:beta-lactamase superfamily II metal-dependent hydrolase
MAAFLVRGFGYTDPGPGDLFADDDTSVFEDDIDRLAVAGVTRGCNPPSNDRFCPDDSVQRDQMASFLGRALKLTPIEPPPTTKGTLTVTFLAVAQGDAAVYEGPCGEVGLIDTNRYKDDDVLAYLDSIGTRDLEWISVSHYDSDHLGGVQGVGTAPGVTVGAVYDRGGDRSAKDANTYRSYYDWTTTAGIRQPVEIGDEFSLCSGPETVTFTVASAGTDGTAAGGVPVSEENDRGLCLHVEFGDFDLATCGDVNGTDEGSRTDVESQVAPIIGNVEVVKVNHHGAIYSSNSTYVTTLDAEAAVISVGKNSYGHPHADVVARWAASGTVFQTQDPDNNALVDGNTVVTTDGFANCTVLSETGRTLTFPLDP